MALIVYKPNLISFCNDRIPLLIRSTSAYETEGSKAAFTLAVSGIDTVPDHSFRLTSGLFDIVFTLKFSTDGSGTQIPHASAGQTYATWGAIISEYLQKNYYLHEYYDFTIEDTGSSYNITLTAKENGADYSIIFSENTVTGVSEGSNTAGVTAVMKTNYALIARIYTSANGTDYEKAGEDLLPTINNEAKFELSGILKKVADNLPEFAFPESVDNILIKRDQVVDYRIEICESIDSIPQSISQMSEAYKALPGGIDWHKRGVYQENTESYFSQLQYNKNFLTWQPRVQTVMWDEIRKLYFFVWMADVTGVRMYVRVTYTDSSQYTYVKTSASAQQYDVFEAVCSFNKLQISALEQSSGKQVQQYEVWITDQDDEQITFTQTFILETTTPRDQRVFLFRNSLSGYDTVRLTGRAEKNVSHERIAGVHDDTEHTTKDHQITNPETWEQQEYTVNSGYVTKQQAEYLREFQMSPEIYELINNRLYPVVLTNTSSNPVHKDGVLLHSVKFTYKRAYRDRNYSEDTNIFTDKNFNKSFSTDYE